MLFSIDPRRLQGETCSRGHVAEARAPQTLWSVMLQLVANRYLSTLMTLLALTDYLQEAIKYLAVLNTVVELLLLACLLGTYRITRKISKKLGESFS